MPFGVIVGQQVLQRVLINGQRVLRGDQVRLAGGDLRLVLLHVQLRHRPDLHTLPVLVELRLGERERLLLHLHIFLRKNQFVIGVLDGGNAGDDLAAHALFGILQPVFAEADVQAGAVNPEILQQRLGEAEPDLAGGVLNRNKQIRIDEGIPAVSARDIAEQIVGHPPWGSAVEGGVVGVRVELRAGDMLAVLEFRAAVVVVVRAGKTKRRVVAAISPVQIVERRLWIVALDLQVEIVRQRLLHAVLQRHRARRARARVCLRGGRPDGQEKNGDKTETFHGAMILPLPRRFVKYKPLETHQSNQPVN